MSDALAIARLVTQLEALTLRVRRLEQEREVLAREIISDKPVMDGSKWWYEQGVRDGMQMKVSVT